MCRFLNLKVNQRVIRAKSFQKTCFFVCFANAQKCWPSCFGKMGLANTVKRDVKAYRFIRRCFN